MFRNLQHLPPPIIRNFIKYLNTYLYYITNLHNSENCNCTIKNLYIINKLCFSGYKQKKAIMSQHQEPSKKVSIFYYL